MKICIVSPTFLGGGAERIAVNLANDYVTKGHEVYFLCFSTEGPYKDQLLSTVILVEAHFRIRYLPFVLPFYIKKIDPDMILSTVLDSNILMGLASFFVKTRLFFHEANTLQLVDNYPVFKRLIFLFIMKLAYSKAIKVIANSADTKKDLLAHVVVNDNQTVIVGNPVIPSHIDKLANEKIEHDWFNAENYQVILNVGRLHIQKNQDFLLQSFAQLHKKLASVRLIILGEGEEYNRLVKLIQELEITELVEIMNFQINPYPYYKNADLFVLTSRWEGFGNVLVEAMACETPVISTDCPGGPNVILGNGEFGDLVPVDDIDALTDKMFKILTQPLNKARLTKAKQRVNEYSIDYIAEQYLDIMSNSV